MAFAAFEFAHQASTAVLSPAESNPTQVGELVGEMVGASVGAGEGAQVGE